MMSVLDHTERRVLRKNLELFQTNSVAVGDKVVVLFGRDTGIMGQVLEINAGEAEVWLRLENGKKGWYSYKEYSTFDLDDSGLEFEDDGLEFEDDDGFEPEDEWDDDDDPIL